MTDRWRELVGIAAADATTPDRFPRAGTSRRGAGRSPASPGRLGHPRSELAGRTPRDRCSGHARGPGGVHRGQGAEPGPAGCVRGGHSFAAAQHLQGCRSLASPTPRDRSVFPVRRDRGDGWPGRDGDGRARARRLRGGRSMTGTRLPRPAGDDTFAPPQARGAGACELRQDREGSSGKRVMVATVRLG